MNIRFRDSALDDLEWFKLYYKDAFPQGKNNAYNQFIKAQTLLMQFPFSGRIISHEKELRFIPITKTPFIIYYAIEDETIWITRVIDNRSYSPNLS